jgi:hypothetical protein
MASDSKPGPCNPACTKVVKFMTDHDVPPFRDKWPFDLLSEGLRKAGLPE